MPCARLPSVCAGLCLLLCDATVWCAAVLGVCSPTVVTRQRQAAVFSGSASARAGRQRRCVAPWGRGTYLWWHLSHGAQGASDCVAAVQAIRVDGGPAGAGRVGKQRDYSHTHSTQATHSRRGAGVARRSRQRLGPGAVRSADGGSRRRQGETAASIGESAGQWPRYIDRKRGVVETAGYEAALHCH